MSADSGAEHLETVVALGTMGWRTTQVSLAFTCAVALLADQPAQAAAASYPPIVGMIPVP